MQSHNIVNTISFPVDISIATSAKGCGFAFQQHLASLNIGDGDEKISEVPVSSS